MAVLSCSSEAFPRGLRARNAPLAPFFNDMSKIQEEARVLIVSPVRNEAAHIARVARAVAGQLRTPARWIVIDDSSTDGTYELLVELAQEIDFMTVMRPPGADPAAGSRDRLAQAVEVRNFNLVIEGVELEQFTHLMKLDGDIELPSDYISGLLERFAADPQLGLAGGTLVEPIGDGYRRIVIPSDFHVHGALKCYTLECFQRDRRSSGAPRLGHDR